MTFLQKISNTLKQNKMEQFKTLSTVNRCRLMTLPIAFQKDHLSYKSLKMLNLNYFKRPHDIKPLQSA